MRWRGDGGMVVVRAETTPAGLRVEASGILGTSTVDGFVAALSDAMELAEPHAEIVLDIRRLAVRNQAAREALRTVHRGARQRDVAVALVGDATSA